MDDFLLVEKNACKLASKLKFYLILSEQTLNMYRLVHAKQDPFRSTFTLISRAFVFLFTLVFRLKFLNSSFFLLLLLLLFCILSNLLSW